MQWGANLVDGFSATAFNPFMHRSSREGAHAGHAVKDMVLCLPAARPGFVTLICQPMLNAWAVFRPEGPVLSAKAKGLENGSPASVAALKGPFTRASGRKEALQVPPE